MNAQWFSGKRLARQTSNIPRGEGTSAKQDLRFIPDALNQVASGFGTSQCRGLASPGLHSLNVTTLLRLVAHGSC
jgi:hypothetical protein